MDIDNLRAYCLSLPAVTEDIKWQHDLVFSVGGKMFCVASLNPPLQFSFKVPDDEYEELSNRDGFIPAPYMARAKWVLVKKPSLLHKQDWEHFVKQSYELVKNKLTKKTRMQLGLNSY